MYLEARYDRRMNRSVCVYCGKSLRKVRRQDAKYCGSSCRMAALRQRRRLQRERKQASDSFDASQQIGDVSPSVPALNSVQACQTLRDRLLGHRSGESQLHEHPFLQTLAEAAACELGIKQLSARLAEIKKSNWQVSERWLMEAGAIVLRDGETIDVPQHVTHIALAPAATTEGAQVVLVIASKE